MLKTRSVESQSSPNDGLRILAARFRGRGLPKSRYDVWMPNLGPSEALLRSFLGGRISWKDFSRRYRAEMFAPGEIDKKNRTILNHGQKFTLRLLQHLAERGDITLLCHCAEEEKHCHRHLLKAILAGRI